MDAARVIFYATVLGGPLLLGLIWWAWAHRRLRSIPNSSPWRWALAAFCGVFSVGYIGLIATRWLSEPWTPHPWIMAYMMLWGLIFLPFLAVPSIGVWSAWRAGRWLARVTWRRTVPPSAEDAEQDIAPAPAAEAADAPPQRMSRRQMIETSLITLPMTATLGATLVSIPQKRRFRITEHTLRLPTLPRGLDGLTIAHISDTHVGKFTRGHTLNRIADATNDLAADLVLMTGDLIDHTIRDLPDALAMVERIDRRSGLFIVEGNHDLFDGRERFRAAVRERGIPLLTDATHTVNVRRGRVQVMGVAWHDRGKPIRPHVASVAAQRDADAFPILLAHHPHAFDGAADFGIPLTLAGHTHGGQLMLSERHGVGPMLFKYWTGVYEQGGSRLVVSNGAGNWFPLRTHAPAEIVHLTLRRA